MSNMTISTIKSIDLKKGQIIIHKIDKNQEKDFLCLRSFYEKTLSTEDLKIIKEGMSIRFIPYIKDNKFYANDLELIREDKTLEREQYKINTESLTNNIIDTLNNNLKHITRGGDFEDFTFLILKILGISEIYAIPRDNAGGRADGVFKVSSVSTNGHKLEVIYDCTLNTKWEDKKKTQIENYEAQISKSSMNISYNFGSTYGGKLVKQTISFNDNADKQIWIITKGESRLIEDKQSPDILIKEISIFDLISIVKEKCLDSAFVKVDEIADKLKNLGSKVN